MSFSNLSRSIKFQIARAFRIMHDVCSPALVLERDSFIKWVEFVIGGWLDQGNIYCMDYVIKNLKSDKPFLEIGSFSGLSTNVIMHLMRKHKKDNVFYTVDPWIWEVTESNNFITDSDIPHTEYREHVMEQFKKGVKFLIAISYRKRLKVLATIFLQSGIKMK